MRRERYDKTELLGSEGVLLIEDGSKVMFGAGNSWKTIYEAKQIGGQLIFQRPLLRRPQNSQTA